MPSKAALHAAKLWQSRQEMARIGVSGWDSLSLDSAQTWQYVRQQRDHFTESATKKTRAATGNHLIQGSARFVEPTLLEVDTQEGVVRIRASAVVIATGSKAYVPDWLAPVRDRSLTTDELFELADLPKRLAVLGLGAVGLETGLVLARLGVEVTGAGNSLAGIDDPVIYERAAQAFGRDMTLWSGQPAQAIPCPQGWAI